MTPPTPKDRVCPDCGSDEISRHSFEECCAILKQQRDAMKAERDAAESLVSAQHDALVAMKNERDWWEHRAEVAERENGEALAMLAFTGEPSSLWQAAAAARRVSGLWSALAEAEQERDDADDALAACQAQAAGTIAQLRDKLDALTAHMNQVHETLGGSDTVLTLEAAQHVVAKLADAERERDRKESWLGEQADIISRGRAENAQLRLKLDAIREEAQATIDLYNNNGPEWTSLQSGEEYYSASYVLGKAQAILDTARTAATACERSSPIASGDTQGE